MGLLPTAKPRCSMCKREALAVKVRTPRGRTVTATFCPRCDNSTTGESRDPRS